MWPPPNRILLATYNRADHAITTKKQGVVGLPVHGRGLSAKIHELNVGDWVLIRISEFGTEYRELIVVGPARIIDHAILEKSGSPNMNRWPTLLWPEEIETNRLVYPYRIPVTFMGGPSLSLGCITWEALRGLRFHTADGQALATPQQWGIKFSGTVVDRPNELAALTRLIEECQPGASKRLPR
jgi:hypothetical protein